MTPRFRIQPGQGDESDPYGHAQVVAEEVKKPERAHEGKRHGEQHDHGFSRRLRVQINQARK